MEPPQTQSHSSATRGRAQAALRQKREPIPVIEGAPIRLSTGRQAKRAPMPSRLLVHVKRASLAGVGEAGVGGAALRPLCRLVFDIVEFSI